MQGIYYTRSIRCACLLVCIAAATSTPITRTTATPITRTLDPARNIRTGRAMRGNVRNLLEILPSVDTTTLNSPPTTPFYEAATSANLPVVNEDATSAKLPEVEDDGFRTHISNVIKTLLDVAFAARETFGKMCNAFCTANGLSTTCCQYVTNNIKSTSEFISDSEMLGNSRTDIERLAAIVRLTEKYTNEINHMTAIIQSEPCQELRACPLSVDSCDEQNIASQFCSLVQMNQRMTAFSTSCQHIMKDLFPTSQPTTAGDSHIAANRNQLSTSQAVPTKLSFTMNANRNLYTIARMIEGLNLILKMLQSLDR